MAIAEPIRLLTGWEPQVPVGDTVLRRFVHAWAESLAGPVAAMGGRVQRRGGLTVGDLGRPAAYYNGATLLRLSPMACTCWRWAWCSPRRAAAATGRRCCGRGWPTWKGCHRRACSAT